MNKDATFTHVHMNAPHHVDIFDEFCRDRLPPDDIYVPPHLQPANPEDEDDVVPDQHAAFGIRRAMNMNNRPREPAWRDLGLADLTRRGPAPPGSLSGGVVVAPGRRGVGVSAGAGGGGGGGGGGAATASAAAVAGGSGARNVGVGTGTGIGVRQSGGGGVAGANGGGEGTANARGGGGLPR